MIALTRCCASSTSEVARRISSYRSYIVEHGCACQPLTPPYLKGGA